MIEEVFIEDDELSRICFLDMLGEEYENHMEYMWRSAEEDWKHKNY